MLYEVSVGLESIFCCIGDAFLYVFRGPGSYMYIIS